MEHETFICSFNRYFNHKNTDPSCAAKSYKMWMRNIGNFLMEKLGGTFLFQICCNDLEWRHIKTHTVCIKKAMQLNRLHGDSISKS